MCLLFNCNPSLDVTRRAYQTSLQTKRAHIPRNARLKSFEKVIERLRAYADAGADCLYAPGIREVDHIRAVALAVAPKPVNLLLSGPASLTGSMNMTMADVAALGVRRVSVGGALARAAWGGFVRAATELATNGKFDGFAGAVSHAELQKLFAGKG